MRAALDQLVDVESSEVELAVRADGLFGQPLIDTLAVVIMQALESLDCVTVLERNQTNIALEDAWIVTFDILTVESVRDDGVNLERQQARFRKVHVAHFLASLRVEHIDVLVWSYQKSIQVWT